MSLNRYQIYFGQADLLIQDNAWFYNLLVYLPVSYDLAIFIQIKQQPHTLRANSGL